MNPRAALGLLGLLLACSTPGPSEGESTQETGPSCELEVMVCETFAQRRVSCEAGITTESARDFCEGEISSSFDNSCACGRAIENWYACMAELECDEFDYQDPFESSCNPASAYNLCGEA